MTKTGFTLMEILVGVGILAILTSIATGTYRGYIQNVEKRALKDSGVLFATALNICIKSMGEDPTPCNNVFKLNFTCPRHAVCDRPLFSTSKNGICLNIKQTKPSGKKLQVVTVVEMSNMSNYVQYCAEPKSDFVTPTATNCDTILGLGGHFPQAGYTHPHTGEVVVKSPLVEDCTNWK